MNHFYRVILQRNDEKPRTFIIDANQSMHRAAHAARSQEPGWKSAKVIGVTEELLTAGAQPELDS